MLLDESQQDMWVAEEVAAALSGMAQSTPELPPNILDGIGAVVASIDRKVQGRCRR